MYKAGDVILALLMNYKFIFNKKCNESISGFHVGYIK